MPKDNISLLTDQEVDDKMAKLVNDPSINVLVVHQDEPEVKRFYIDDEVMILPISLKKRVLLNYVLQLQEQGYCNASNAWFAKKTRTADKDSISTLMVAMEEEGLLKITRIFEKGTEQILERRIRPTRKLQLLLDPLPPKVQVGVPPKPQEIIPKGIVSVKKLKLKRNKPVVKKHKFGREI